MVEFYTNVPQFLHPKEHFCRLCNPEGSPVKYSCRIRTSKVFFGKENFSTDNLEVGKPPATARTTQSKSLLARWKLPTAKIKHNLCFFSTLIRTRTGPGSSQHGSSQNSGSDQQNTPSLLTKRNCSAGSKSRPTYRTSSGFS